MSGRHPANCALEPVCVSSSAAVVGMDSPEPAASTIAQERKSQVLRMVAVCDTTSQSSPAPLSRLETLPAELVFNILSYLIHPRSRLPGLTEAQSSLDFDPIARSTVKKAEDLTTPADTGRWATDLFKNHHNRHPFHTLSLTSRTCNIFVESYCASLAREHRIFNLPFAQVDSYGPNSVWPDLSRIVYRRLWLQSAPRKCIYCFAVMDRYPFPILKHLLTNCKDCFYRQTLSLDEIERQYHISPHMIFTCPSVRGYRDSVWFLRVDVEALALQLYGTRAFHSAHQDQFGKPCAICAITNFTSVQRSARLKPGQKMDRRVAVQRKKLRHSSRTTITQ
ncbi:hypothetical protein DE146DRAFT_601318 [Phaeosphaeria sp. MPI-PUGE-AT-0046c]|nr:hypothetical protein DE146DRAFT_601318 [Phaeosphaeria sp. MPI-PUGE-AT-0046c]